MRIGIIGAGAMGANFARVWARGGHEVLLSYSRDPAKLDRLAEQIGSRGRSGTPSQAVDFGELVLLAVRWEQIEDALARAARLQGQVLISCVTPLLPGFSGLVVGHTTSAAERVAELAAGARVVEAFNSVFAALIDPRTRPQLIQTPTVFYCGDDSGAKEQARELIATTELDPVDAGVLRSAGYIEPFGAADDNPRLWQGLGSDIAVRLLRTPASTSEVSERKR